MFKYLYIAEELEYYELPEDHESRIKYGIGRVPLPTGYCKIGVTSQDVPAERLRKLLVGNHRLIQFSHMWIGETWSIEWLEQYVLNAYYNERIREWVPYDAKKVAKTVKKGIAHKQYSNVFEVPAKYLPYKATSYGECVFKNKKKDTTAVFF